MIQKFKKIPKGKACVITGCLLPLILLFWGYHSLSKGYLFNVPSPNNPVGMQKLKAIVRQGGEVVAYARKYKLGHGKYPDTIPKFPPAFQPSIHGNFWSISPDDRTGTFILYYKLDWDAGVRYEFDEKGENLWRYDPGDGKNSETIITP